MLLIDAHLFVIFQKLKDNPNYYNQKASLKQLKIDRPWYKNIHSQVLQEVPKRIELAFERCLQGDCNGKKSGRPRFKAKGRYRTFTYPQFKQHHFGVGQRRYVTMWTHYE